MTFGASLTSGPDVQIIFEKKPTATQLTRALKYRLPPTFYFYEDLPVPDGYRPDEDFDDYEIWFDQWKAGKALRKDAPQPVQTTSTPTKDQQETSAIGTSSIVVTKTPVAGGLLGSTTANTDTGLFEGLSFSFGKLSTSTSTFKGFTSTTETKEGLTGGQLLGTSTSTGGLFGTSTSTGGLFGTSTSTGELLGTSTSTGELLGTSTSTGGLFGTSTSTGGLFGTSTSTAGKGLFATPEQQTAPFGSANKTVTAKRFRGFVTQSSTTATSTGLFGATQQTPSLFGSGLIKSTGLFGAVSATEAGPTGTTVKFEPVSGSDTMMQNGVSQNVRTAHQCITAMKEYETKSLEELRMEDYMANRKGGSTGATTLFKLAATTQAKGDLVGTNTSSTRPRLRARRKRCLP
ncbi:nucleoporin NUP145-like [Branchiostoma floridae]|uniref:Nuclear pore complex protein Nup98-Nup96 n=1 Tax=Branchiostoma floridae TaxID=7739 RepID=A0A9J7M0R1_BRAFL|nr:nucleoporin NUP145-like [Branchiostoma floridae]